MGYEMRFYIVNKSKVNYIEDKSKCYAEIVAMYNYCKDYNLANFITKEGFDTDCYIYADNDDNPTIRDKYGDYLKEIDIEKLIEYFKYNPNNDYRRYKPFVETLKAFRDNKDKFDNLAVLRYGY